MAFYKRISPNGRDKGPPRAEFYMKQNKQIRSESRALLSSAVAVAAREALVKKHLGIKREKNSRMFAFAFRFDVVLAFN